MLCLIPIPVYTLAETPLENVKILLRGNLRIMSSLSTPENEGLLYSLILFSFSWQETDRSVLPVRQEDKKVCNITFIENPLLLISFHGT